MKIVPYQKEYQNQIAELILNIQRNEYHINITIEEQPDLKDIKHYFQKGAGNFWMALEENQVVGTIALLDIENGEAVLKKVFVRKEYRGKERGIAMQLLQTLFTWAKEKEIKTIYLGTHFVFQAAHHFYEKNGFKEISKEELPDSFPLMDIDHKFYKCSVMGSVI